MDLDAHHMPAPHRPHGYPSRSRPDRPLVALGVVAIVASALGFCGWTLVAIGIGTCSGTSASSTCHHVRTVWDLTGACLAAAFAVGIVTTIVAGRRRSPLVRRVLALTTIGVLTLVVAVATHLWTLSTGS